MRKANDGQFETWEFQGRSDPSSTRLVPKESRQRQVVIDLLRLCDYDLGTLAKPECDVAVSNGSVGTLQELRACRLLLFDCARPNIALLV